MDITFLGATGTVTGSCYLVTVGDRHVMVDCGLYQGLPELIERNYTHPSVRWSEIDVILLTHAHVDHSGLIPRAVKNGFRGYIYTHPATIDLCDILFRDSVEIQKRDAEWISRKHKRAGLQTVRPLYDLRDAIRALKKFRPVEYGEIFEVVPGVSAEYRDAGHILGSASIALDCTENGVKKRIVFSGDLGHHQAPILKEPVGFEKSDAVLIETTYGNRAHESGDLRWKKLKEIIVKAAYDGGKILIPAFAVGRTQEILYIISQMMGRNEVPRIPIFLDSPMAIEATEIHANHSECFDSETLERLKRGENPFKPEMLKMTLTVPQSRKINSVKGSAIIIAGGGMCEGGRIQHHLKHNLYNPTNHLVFVGYQAIGTLGRAILNGERKIRLFKEDILIKAKISAIGAFSAHADKNGLIDWLGKFQTPPETVFLIHGEEHSSKAFSETVREKLGFPTYIPKPGQMADLENLSRITEGERRFIQIPMPETGDLHEIVSRVSVLGDEFHEAVTNYATFLAKRITEPELPDGEPLRKTQEVSDILQHLSEVVGTDVEKLKQAAYITMKVLT
ncbi:MAG: MBL fold metallo-hydrolase [bacterium]